MSDSQGLNHVRILVVGETGVGKSTLVSNLCGSPPVNDESTTSGCVISVRPGFDRSTLFEFYDVGGSHRFEHGRQLFYRAVDYDALMFVHDLTDPSTRTALSRIWVPEAMIHFGDIKAVDAGGRAESAGTHARSRGVLNELRLLWLHIRSKHGGIRPYDASREAFRLCCRLLRLLLNEYEVWTDEHIDRQAEKDLLSSASLPIAIVGLKRDLAPSWSTDYEGSETAKNTSAFVLSSFESVSNSAMNAFLRRSSESTRRRASLALSQESASNMDVELTV